MQQKCQGTSSLQDKVMSAINNKISKNSEKQKKKRLLVVITKNPDKQKTGLFPGPINFQRIITLILTLKRLMNTNCRQLILSRYDYLVGILHYKIFAVFLLHTDIDNTAQYAPSIVHI